MVVGPLVPRRWPDLVERAGDLLEVHERVTVETAWAGPLILGVTWHPAAVQAGLAGTLFWDGTSDMDCAVAPVASYAVADDRFRRQKELLPSRLCSLAQRTLRDDVLAEIAHRDAALSRCGEKIRRLDECTLMPLRGRLISGRERSQ